MKTLIFKFDNHSFKVQEVEDGLFDLNDLRKQVGNVESLKQYFKSTQSTSDWVKWNLDEGLKERYQLRPTRGRGAKTLVNKVGLTAYALWLGFKKEDLISVLGKDTVLSAISPERSYCREEHGALCAIEQLLGVEISRQYTVEGVGDVFYRIDGYDPANNIAYEIDEPQHFKDGVLKDDCILRQKYIESVLDCKFVRIKV